MKNKFKKFFYWAAFIDVKHTCNKKETYFWLFRKDIVTQNMKMMRSISVFLSVICIFLTLVTFTRFESESLRNVYLTIFLVELIISIVVNNLMKYNVNCIMSNIITCIYLFHILVLAGYIGVVYCPTEPATVYAVVLIISSMIFALPPILSNTIVVFCTIATLIASYFIKGPYWFESDVLNCSSVFLFSLLLGWNINKIRAEEAFAQAHIQILMEELKQISVTDKLTGLPNHRSFQDDYYELFLNACKKDLRIGVIMMDLDNFKSYNDQYGHIEGDKCLQSVSEVFSSYNRQGVTIYRYGGEEFIALLNDSACDQASVIAEELRVAVQNLNIRNSFSKVETIITISVGLYVGKSSNNEKPMNFLDRADKAMYCSKQEGKNRLTIVS